LQKGWLAKLKGYKVSLSRTLRGLDKALLIVK